MRKSSKIALAIALATGQMAMAMPAWAQSDVVMRRPIPRDANVGSTPDGTTPPVTSDPSVPDEPTLLCDGNPGSPQPQLIKAEWVQTGWQSSGTDSSSSCTIQKMGYVCQTTYACQIGGGNTAFTSIAPDSICAAEPDPQPEQPPEDLPPDCGETGCFPPYDTPM